VTFSRVEIKETCGIDYIRSKPHFPPRIREEKLEFLGVIMGYKNSNKVLAAYPWPRRSSLRWGGHMLGQ